ncbi:MAG: autotransporter-associated beta strand repeat-containing protein [Kiritimatiellae bacterium]|nr:autotransporter-associated beta strand repeat-containing protein [Kiritimatiellia bacterium]
MNYKTIIAMTAVFAAFNFATADTCTWINGSTGGWADPNSWNGNAVPDSTSTVAVPNGVDLPVNDADVAIAGSVAGVELGSGSRIVFNLESTDCSMNGTITGSGTIVKNGAATLRLLNTDVDGYYTTGGFQVNAGTNVLPQTFLSSYDSTVMKVGPVYVADGAVFMPYARYRATNISSLSGKGTIRQELSGGSWPLRITGPSSFEGALNGYINLLTYSKFDILGTNNFFSSNSDMSLHANADLGVTMFGNRTTLYSSLAARHISSTGTTYPNLAFHRDARVRYLGTGETTDRHFMLNGAVDATIDAGATGDLHLTGRIFQNSAKQSVLTLAGSNTVAASFSGAFDEYDGNSTFITKTGTGTWILRGATNRFNKGVVGVEEGTLQFDTLAETNTPCSFGLSTLLAQKYTGDWDATKTADYAILLGSADAEGTLEYIGTNLWDNAASTRPVAVTGQGGRIVSSVAGRRIGIKGAMAADAGGGTLTLDGAGTTNYLYNAADGHGTLSISKEGTGTWVLAGDQTFGGKLDVKGGELVVSSTLGTKYSWYRFTILETVSDPARIREIALFDAQGNRTNKTLTDLGANAIPQMRQVSVWSRSSYSSFVGTGGANYSVSKLFDASTDWKSIAAVTCGGARPQRGVPTTWVPFVMRLNDTDSAVLSYDFVPDKENTHKYSPTCWLMEASAEGVFWDKVHEVIDSAYECSGGSSWMSDNSVFSASSTHSGFQFGLDKGKSLITAAPSQLANATVSVANGAVLRAEGSVSISSVEVDVSKPAGTIDGFNFASGGTLNIVGDADLSGRIVLPVNIVNASGTQNISSWTATANGHRAAGKLAFEDGNIVFTQLGTTIIMR